MSYKIILNKTGNCECKSEVCDKIIEATMYIYKRTKKDKDIEGTKYYCGFINMNRQSSPFKIRIIDYDEYINTQVANGWKLI
jgi:hypothetical protein